MTPRADLDAELDTLAAVLPQFILQHPDPDEFWNVFAGESDHLLDNAAPDDYEHVRGRLDAMLADNGMLPVDE